MIYFGKTRINLFSYDASAKPRLDTEEILKGMGFAPLIVSAFEEVKDVKLRVEQELANIKENDIIIVQYPSFSIIFESSVSIIFICWKGWNNFLDFFVCLFVLYL